MGFRQNYPGTKRPPKKARPSLVLPLHYVTSSHSPVVMDAPFFQKLAREVYDRCPPAAADNSSARLPIQSGAAVQLEQPLPRKIDFKLQAEPPAELLHEGSNLHLGYARSSNNEWVSVAWTDTTGKYQASSNYCLLGGRSFAEVARVIWQSTIEIMQARRVAWRLCIARVGTLEKEELDGELFLLMLEALQLISGSMVDACDFGISCRYDHRHHVNRSVAACDRLLRSCVECFERWRPASSIDTCWHSTVRSLSGHCFDTCRYTCVRCRSRCFK